MNSLLKCLSAGAVCLSMSLVLGGCVATEDLDAVELKGGTLGLPGEGEGEGEGESNIAGDNTGLDCSDVQTSCMEQKLTPCTCAASDPCGWSGDGACDERCGELVDTYFDDSEDCGGDTNNGGGNTNDGNGGNGSDGDSTITISLTWESNADLDLVLTRTNTHDKVDYQSKSANWGTSRVELTDVVQGPGTEEVTIFEPVACDWYTVFAVKFSDPAGPVHTEAVLSIESGESTETRNLSFVNENLWQVPVQVHSSGQVFDNSLGFLGTGAPGEVLPLPGVELSTSGLCLN